MRANSRVSTNRLLAATARNKVFVEWQRLSSVAASAVDVENVWLEYCGMTRALIEAKGRHCFISHYILCQPGVFTYLSYTYMWDGSMRFKAAPTGIEIEIYFRLSLNKNPCFLHRLQNDTHKAGWGGDCGWTQMEKGIYMR